MYSVRTFRKQILLLVLVVQLILPLKTKASFDFEGSCDRLASTSCNEKGIREQEIILYPNKETKYDSLGILPIGITNVKFKFKVKEKMSISLQDEETSLPVLNFTFTSTSFPESMEEEYFEYTYNNMTIWYDNNSFDILGRITTPLEIMLYSEAGQSIQLMYIWGLGAGRKCKTNEDCASGLYCKNEHSYLDYGIFRSHKRCHVSNWCLNSNTVLDHCSSSTIEEFNSHTISTSTTCVDYQCHNDVMTGRGLIQDERNNCTNRLSPSEVNKYLSVELSELVIESTSSSSNLIGKKVVVTSTVILNPVACTYMRCFSNEPCCNTCRAGASFEYIFLNNEEYMGCFGTECDWMNHCLYQDGDMITVYGEVGPYGNSIIVHDHCYH